MSTTFIKICGLTTREQIRHAVAAGANAIGFVFAPSPRQLAVADAIALGAEVPATVKRVAVVRAPSAAELGEIVNAFRPDWLQMEAAQFARGDVPPDVTRLPVFRDSDDLDEAEAAAEPQVLFEGLHSGRGQTADWQRAARLARSTRLVLAGGLTPENVAAAIDVAHPWGVDVSSGVESSPAVKDPGKVDAFIAAVRSLDTNDAH